MDDLTRKRLEHNEAVFRTVNQEIDERGADTGLHDYVCECADLACSDTVQLDHAEYAGVRARPHHYFVRPTHERPALEQVVEQTDRYVVVDKGP